MKAKILRMSNQIILNMFGPGFHPAYECIENPLPQDAKIRGMQVRIEEASELWLRIESEEFPEIEEGYRLPFLETPVFRKCED
jgi:hypothetical protein